MPFIEINGASVYYETFGRDRPGRAPIVLIHGSTQTGRACWELVAPLLAREYQVVVPDNRGHGQSSNPDRSYSFREMAADTAELICALGYPRAHVIGHSNGGNVALVTLLEHPEVVQTCVAQAANAYVSPDLIEREPAIFDPDRVAREAPEWMNEMIALHGPTHGPDYWRDLLRMTVQELIAEPNYTPGDLARVQRPILVIQGENDPVNAPARHARFIAQHIPNAELWIPAGVGHNVHHERLFDWVTRVIDFLARRGDDANEALYRVRRARYADSRETVFEVNLSPGRGGEGGGVLSGQVLTADQHRAALDALPARPDIDEVRVLLTDETPWALTNRSVADLRREPHSLSERASQALIGEAVRVLEQQDDWSRVWLERDGYLGWIQTSVLHLQRAADVQSYLAASNGLIVAELAQATLAATPAVPPLPRHDAKGTGGGGDEAGKLPFGVTLPVIERRDGCLAIRLPDDRVWWVAEADVIDTGARPRTDASGVACALRLIQRSIGVPYLWGGRSPFGYDCSGLAQTFWAFLGVQIPRDADQQFRAGKPVDGAPQPGDLLFFGEPDDHGISERYAHITHVAISLGGHEMIHANGAVRGVSRNSLDPSSPIYRAWLREHLVGVRRFA